MESNVKSENTEAIGLGQRIVNFLAWPKLGALLLGLFAAAFLLWPAISIVLNFTIVNGWQISGYYCNALFVVIMGLPVLVWLASVVVLFFRRQFAAFLKRLLLFPFYLFMVLFILSFIVVVFHHPRHSGWPIDTVYSPSQGKYYILAEEPMFTDVAYRIFSTKGTLLNPVWTLEFSGNDLDYSEDGSLTSDPHLILSGDEEVLVVARGGELTDALLLSSRKSVGGTVIWNEQDHVQKWQARTARIRSLLKEHGTPASQPVGKLTSQDIRAALHAWADSIGKLLDQDLASLYCKASCKILSINEEQFPQAGLVHVEFEVYGLQYGHEYRFRREMSLVRDGRRLVITKQDNGICYSNSREEQLVTKVRDLLNKYAGASTVIPAAE